MPEKRPLELSDDGIASDNYTGRAKSRKIESKTDNTNDDKPKFPKILDGTYYKIVEYDKENDSVEAKCMNCTKKDVIIRGSRTSTGNFHTHYTRRHSDHTNDVKDYCDENKIERKKVERPKLQSVLPFKFALDPMKVIALNRSSKCV